jgi:hypothetical protein
MGSDRVCKEEMDFYAPLAYAVTPMLARSTIWWHQAVMPPNKFKKYASPLSWIIALVIAAWGVPFIIGGEPFRQKYAIMSLIVAVHWIVILWLVWFAFEKAETFSDLPPVLVFERSIGALITEGRSWMGIGIAVSVYQRVGTIERLICHGVVGNIQQDTKTQIQLIPLDSDEIAEVYDRVDVISRTDLIIKPGQVRGQF